MDFILFISIFFLTSIAVAAEDWSLHFQTTVVTQGHGSFTSPYSGPLSLSGDPETRTSLTSTLFLGRKLWEGSAFYVDPEIAGGSGVSSTHGVAGYPNGEIYRVDSPDPKLSLSRIYWQQVFNLGEGKETLEPDKNQLGTELDKTRFTVVLGKFSLNDFFDDNTYSHDPRTQFLNWTLMDNGAWDYAADTRGYTWGFYLELKKDFWTLRAASVLEPDEANQLGMDQNIHGAHGDNVEFETRYQIKNRTGVARLLYYVNHAFMGSYGTALAQSPTAPDITQSRDYRTKYGGGVNIEQELTDYFGLFGRWGQNDGKSETWAFTEIDSTFSLGLNIKGALWARALDNVGVAFVSNGLSPDHLNYLAAGGIGFIVGDGKLNYAREQILETYYLFKLFQFFGLTADYQLVVNPAYNQDRGPVSIFAGRLHYEF